MSVINTNYLALVSQNNLTKSQGALGQAIERLSSGLRINSAKDDAAGQAIANRFTANIKGLTQASRNANDGISIAQTTEGALNEINNNLQRIRELSVQAANGSNSETDLASIQAEITQRLEEIDRVSGQTQFNGQKVLSSEAGSLVVQVGSRDSETIEINLREISSSTLGLGTFSIENSVTSKNLTAVTKGNEIDVTSTVTIAPNTYAPSTPGPNGPVLGLHADGALYASKTAGEFVVKAEDNNFYALDFNAATQKWVWDSSAGSVAETGVDTSGPITSLPVYDTTLDGTEAVAALDATVVTNNGAGNNKAGVNLDLTVLYEVNHIENDAAGTQSFAVKDTVTGDYYLVTGKAAYDTVGAGDKADPGSYDWTWDTLDVDDPTAMTLVSSSNVGAAVTQIAVGEFTATPEVDLYNEDLGSAPTSAGLYALSSGTGYVVKTTDGEYYAADVTDPANVTWDSDTTAVDGALVDTTAALGSLVTGTANGNITGLAPTGETLHSYEDADGVTQYAVKSVDADGNATYSQATVTPNATTGDIAVTKGAELTVDPLAMLDNALQNVDNLRSELGAVQNRFQSTIANLANTVNNLSAARSRIEDADYAVEVSNMTRAQILQQAGTSVLAQANQVPQTVLSLLR